MRNRLLLCLVILLAPSIADACQPYRDVLQDLKGNVIVAADITVNIAATGTLAVIYSDSLCAVSKNNPIQSGSDGSFSFYAADGNYDLLPTKTGYVFSAITGVTIYDPLGENVVTVGGFPGTDICANGTGAIDSIGATVKTLVINKAVTCLSSKTIPSTLTLVHWGQGLVTVSAAMTLTVNGAIIAAPSAQIFAGSGTTTISGTANPITYAAWTGTAGIGILPSATIFSALGSFTNGTVAYCSDCTVASPCAGSGTGAIAKRLNSTWVCN